MLAKMIDKTVSLKETKIFEIDGQTYADASLTRIPPHVDRPDCISVSGLDSIWKLEAKKNIADYFLKNMGDLIDAGKVVVMQ